MRDSLDAFIATLVVILCVFAGTTIFFGIRHGRLDEENRKVCALLYERSHTVADTLQNVRTGCLEVKSE
jgi:hypothetical protein